MHLTSGQRSLISAVEGGNAHLARFYLQQGIEPNFFFSGSETPLTCAIRNHDIDMVKLLVKYGADTALARPGVSSPLDLAEDIGDLLNDYSIVRYLRDKPPLLPDDPVSDIPAATPAYTRDTLSDVFSPARWAGRLGDMAKEWEKVPAALKKDFDFAARVAEVRRQNLKRKSGAPKNPPL